MLALTIVFAGLFSGLGQAAVLADNVRSKDFVNQLLQVEIKEVLAGYLVAGYSSSVLKENREFDRTFLKQAAIRMAAAGLEKGILALNQQDWSAWEYNVDWAKRVLSATRVGKNVTGAIVV